MFLSKAPRSARDARGTSPPAARRITLLLAVLVPAVMLHSCTDLKETPTSSITGDNFYRTDQEVKAGVAAVYAQLRTSMLGNYYFLSEISSDEMVVPTRGQDWYDNGMWLETHRQLWAANSAAGLSLINGAWVDAFTGIARANVVLGALSGASAANRAVLEAELRTLRAFYYYVLMDMFGGVPIVTTTDIAARPRSSRAEVFKFIEDELKAARPALPVQWPLSDNGRVTRGAADAILANMYLNAQVFSGNVTAGGLQKGPARWQDAIDAADRVINAAVYSLASSWRSNFAADNDLSPEHIMAVKHLNQDGLGMYFIFYSLHYNQFSPSPFNGFSTTADVYNAFDADDKRREMFLVGPQFNLETGEPVNDRAGQRLVFTPEIKDITQATEGEGVRPMKWPPDPAHVGYENGNDFALFRLAEMYLIKAEALNELGRTAEAVPLVNTLRARVFSPARPVTIAAQSGFRDLILRERLFELATEGKRRQDLIRMDKYTTAFAFKQQREGYRALMPIPQPQLSANPRLVQNAGY